MLSQCPHCHKQLQLTEAQRDKVAQALAALPEGKTLKIGCPLCHNPIHLRRDGSLAHEARPESGAEKAASPPAASSASADLPDKAPKPPDISLLQQVDESSADEAIRDVPLAMILMAEGDKRRRVTEAMEAQGYQVEFPESAAAAIERMRFVSFAAVVLHSYFEGGKLGDSSFHQHMRKMPMAGRRQLLYVLIGPEFNTLYDLEALTLSANLTVNEQDLDRIKLIIKKSRHDHRQLFGPLLQVMQEHGKI
ncbi:hypothetical protein [Desulfurivibrio alkaliphilus]|uniref:Uncharacterized protein n=1 Tax=Desulfurivibrio alkaliphilus (strain DSM 19089 / UNIQEM U267 / AHT2) TaxID=589865 RepID=D6Z3R3_DESAT|nr:hypothetical protein [Desulfurivibrio alkaliphilus]ADH86188.1 conserved hypothetical protein [Desulfurivibrio alkaliphilus AHT 2]